MMVRMGFAEGWRRWIRACVFQSTMSVLVNGSTTEDFNVSKGLRQGDPLSPFLFLIVAEGLTGLMNKAMDNSLFQGYKVSNNISFHTLQFADDTIIVGEDSWDNLWSIKIVLRSFELVSGLKVNFYKSKLYGINLDDSFLRAASSFLNCGVESIPFRFLGIPVGANLRRRATWLHILELMKKRLSAWNGLHLSIGGRVTLINS
ncbi:LINE-1 reverse transcriptase like, partial [Trifolium medium]|nr:LINE-1 reverse transcriptase like [Trifolium medium]